ncbi:ATP-dependent helicase [Tuwongella immobilis]|uniref:DNA 3'-5' helicase n=1 Tax=Tuwongella immobilis TaxID=692036 RepID=A0A6C2YLY6_9BACT|nr:UvrD-helicase domain-containing protein [Tuwongella immobilis]VIP02384.1 atp-dependent dna helicase : DNA helicase OS=Singulisphaera acidiphila (strain ATCC BAA-1392 / DSM 18658 / VKM B-2454 / MOB10) GN=Sinac_5592 PE=4 SV=1: UvrD-helicase: UvrD_C [Tuwongella immobilis]VTS01238.1 atp-dependent dna helicase : DNA helicase OS=Singulisphaera acidiphila (strain ATCC BAA-1392 / DSM 18658 / VKM B-2454 / MOB10) GN=Sinac_5592 PE=4 SV=1: UvrD-helicase: UvrD_C [Tuwongella immobilis]
MARESSAASGDESKLLADLTADQQAAVVHGTGPLLILAAAGSGKTRVITRRVAYLLSQGIRASNILAITFTNKAAGEMRRRVDQLVPGNRVTITTFHSLGARLLRQYADRLKMDPNFTIYDTTDRNKLIKDALDLAGLDNVKFTPDRIGGGISKAKNQLLTPDRFQATSADYFTQVVARIYAIYEKRLRDANAVDFDDLLYLPALALKHDEELRAELDSRYQYILIDEYQDTNHAQYELVRRLARDYDHLCVVGDPDQSIYGWRGSNIRNILDFERDYPEATVITLDRNYRSTPNILAAAGHLIEHNVHRKQKSLLTDNPPGDPVRILTFDTGLDEAELVVERIRREVLDGKARYRDHAIFLRINALSRSLESAFVKHGVPFQIVKGLAFFDRKENRDLLAYLRLLVNPQDDLSFQRVVNEPPRGIGAKSIEHLKAYAEDRQISLLAAAGDVLKIPAIKGKAAAGLRDFHQLMTGLRSWLEQPPDVVIREVIDRSGYRAMLKAGDEDDQERLANIEEMITAAQQFAQEDPTRTLGNFLEQITLASDVDSWDEQQDCVSVMTLHAAKGLEFPIVYMLAMEQGLLPHERSLAKDEEIEEERRLCFVGMTRAMRQLNLCHAKLREFRGQALYTVPSMFLDELPKVPTTIERVDLSGRNAYGAAMDAWRRGGSPAAEGGWDDTGVRGRSSGSPGAGGGGYGSPIRPTPRPVVHSDDDEVQYRPGMIVEHETYGRGKITDISGYGAMRRMKIRFVTAGEKVFVAQKAKLRILSVPD